VPERDTCTLLDQHQTIGPCLLAAGPDVSGINLKQIRFTREMCFLLCLEQTRILLLQVGGSLTRWGAWSLWGVSR